MECQSEVSPNLFHQTHTGEQISLFKWTLANAGVRSMFSVFSHLIWSVGEEKAVLGSGGKWLLICTCHSELGSLPWDQENPQCGKTSNPQWATVLLLAWKALPANHRYRTVLPPSPWLALSWRLWSVKWWQRYIFKCMYAFLCMEGYKYWVFTVKNKYPTCGLTVLCMWKLLSAVWRLVPAWALSEDAVRLHIGKN